MLPVGEDEHMAVRLGVSVIVCAIHRLFVVRCSVLYARIAREASSQAVLVYGRASKVASLGS